MKEIKDIIKILREDNNLTQEQFANIIGASRQTVSNYELGKRTPTDEVKEKIADYFNVDMDYLMGRSETKNRYQDSLSLIGKVSTEFTYPYIPNPVAAGVPETIEGLNEISKISIPDFMLGKYAGSKNIIIMKVNGDSMNRIIPNESLIGVYHNYPIENLKDGDIVVFNDEYEYSLKRFYDSGDYIVFKPDSYDPVFKDIIINKERGTEIIGKVVMYTTILD